MVLDARIKDMVLMKRLSMMAGRRMVLRNDADISKISVQL